MSPMSGITFIGWIVLKIRQRLASRYHDWQVRRDERSFRRDELSSSVTLLPWHPLAAVPGAPEYLPWAAGRRTDTCYSELAAAVHAHRFKLLSSSSVEIRIEDQRRSAAVEALGMELPEAAVKSYSIIDWHCDIHSGYRWPADELYLDVRVGPKRGADIKTPRELSRFQHVGALAEGPLEEGGVEFLLELLDWIVANPVRRGPNWACTMDVALRAINWIWGIRLFEPVIQRFPHILSVLTQSLYEHGLHIENNLEYYEDLTGNHYLSDIVGLIYIGAACPDFPESDRWLLFGLQELISEMGREVHADGGAHEASTHYHRLVAELFLSATAVAERIPSERRRRLTKVQPHSHRVRPKLKPIKKQQLNLDDDGALFPAHFYARLARMAEFSAALTKPNNRVPQIGDNDSSRVHKIAPAAVEDFSDHAHVLATAGELMDRADLRECGVRARGEAQIIAGDLRGRLPMPRKVIDWGAPAILFEDTGVAILKEGSAWLAITCGTNGQGGRGGHGHNDKNAFELNVQGLDIFVDGGCPAYSNAPEIRNKFRATAAHSTVSIEGHEQDRWDPGQRGLFRLRERSSPVLRIEHRGVAVGQHTGFGVEHIRNFDLHKGQLCINDSLYDSRRRWITFNLDPAVAVESISLDDDAMLSASLRHHDGLILNLTSARASSFEVVDGCFGLGYGQPVANTAIRILMGAPTARTTIRWAE